MTEFSDLKSLYGLLGGPSKVRTERVTPKIPVSHRIKMNRRLNRDIEMII